MILLLEFTNFQPFFRLFNPYQAKMTNSVVKTWLRYQLAVKSYQIETTSENSNFKIDKIFKQLIAILKIWDDITRIKTRFVVFKGRVIWKLGRETYLFWSTRSNWGQLKPKRGNLFDLKLYIKFRKKTWIFKILGVKFKPEMSLFWELLNFLQRNMGLTSSNVQTNRLSPKTTE